MHKQRDLLQSTLKTSRTTGRGETFTLQLMPPGQEEELTPGADDLAGSSQAINLGLSMLLIPN